MIEISIGRLALSISNHNFALKGFVMSCELLSRIGGNSPIFNKRYNLFLINRIVEIAKGAKVSLQKLSMNLKLI